MEKNFTPLVINSTKGSFVAKSNREEFDINTIFLILIVVTLFILAVLLFLLIQKKMQELAIVGLFA